MDALWPQIQTWMVDTIPGLPGLSDVVVTAGAPFGESDPDRYAVIGYVDVTDTNGGTFTHAQVYDGTAVEETGEIRSQFVSQVGDSDPAPAVLEAFAMVNPLNASILADMTLGRLLSPEATVRTTVEVHTVTNSRGYAIVLLHVLSYTSSSIET